MGGAKASSLLRGSESNVVMGSVLPRIAGPDRVHPAQFRHATDPQQIQIHKEGGNGSRPRRRNTFRKAFWFEAILHNAFWPERPPHEGARTRDARYGKQTARKCCTRL